VEILRFAQDDEDSIFGDRMPTPTTTTQSFTGAKLPGTSRLILVASREYPRFSEADVVVLKDGRLLLAVARKNGASDFAVGELIGMSSLDGGLTWDDRPHVIDSPSDDVVDLMSVSFCRSPRGLHLFFLGRGKDAKRDTRIYQMISTDEGATWSKRERINGEGYHIVNNARVIRTSKGRMIIPSAHTDGPIDKEFDRQHVFCTYSDDDGKTWQRSNLLALKDQPLMEPGVAECVDGSLYMTIRTKLGTLYEARSSDGGATWADLKSSGLPAPAAPSTVVRDPKSSDLWMFWCPNSKGDWKGRTPQVFARSKDNGRTWSEPKPIENDPKHSYGYISVTFIPGHALLTYYDWADNAQPAFRQTNLRERMIPLAWFNDDISPPVFSNSREPVLKKDRDDEGKVISVNSGVLAERDRWRMWYTSGALGPKGEQSKVCFAESSDQGRTWTKPATNVVFPIGNDQANCYHTSAHRFGESIVCYVWHRIGPKGGLLRYVSDDNGQTFRNDPENAYLFGHHASKPENQVTDADHFSNDAFDMLQNPEGGFEYYAAVLEKATDPRTIIKHDNAAGWLRYIGRSTSRDGISFAPIEMIIRPDFDFGDPYDTQFYGLQVFRYRRFYLGLLFTYHASAQTIQPEWAWSHNGLNWSRTRTPCISLGDEGTFDSRMILFGSVVALKDELVWIYSGYDWRHNAFKNGEVSASIGRATLARRELDAWLDTLPQP
jgi:hypothetical protein